MGSENLTKPDIAEYIEQLTPEEKPTEMRARAIKRTTTKEDVYFVRCLETDRVKIGCSRSVKSRIATLMTQNSTTLRLECVIKGMGMELEKYIHNVYDEFRHHGEWFDKSEKIDKFIEYVQKKTKT